MATRTKLDREARHKSENIEDDVLSDTVKALRRRIRCIDRTYDIPYIAGYSRDGRVIFIDRHLPRSFSTWTKRVQVDPFIATHEIIEKALLDQLGLHYLHAHQIALRTERAAVEAAGISWRAYEGFMKSCERKIEQETLQRVPASLDLTPYRHQKDFALLERLVRQETRSRRK